MPQYLHSVVPFVEKFHKTPIAFGGKPLPSPFRLIFFCSYGKIFGIQMNCALSCLLRRASFPSGLPTRTSKFRLPDRKMSGDFSYCWNAATALHLLLLLLLLLLLSLLLASRKFPEFVVLVPENRDWLASLVYNHRTMCGCC